MKLFYIDQILLDGVVPVLVAGFIEEIAVS